MTTMITDTDFFGLTETDCCGGCGPDYCVLSGKAYCAHPRKGGLHFGQMQDSAALRRLQQARDRLAMDSLEAKLAARRTA